ncbi:MAG: hypothetical protein HY291_13940 [Planctomycetes bacterium]|nr:hypothetical protein [Planctomycetota bacterium]
MRAVLFALALAAAWRLGAAEPDGQVVRYVTFRDGAVLKVTLPDTELKGERVDADGTSKPSAWKLSRTETLDFAAQPDLKIYTAALKLIAKLGDDEFGVREQAAKELEKLAPKMRGELAKAYTGAEDTEVRNRLAQILAQAPAGHGERLTDELIADGNGAPEHGVVADWKLTADAGGAAVDLDRAHVLRLSAQPFKHTEILGKDDGDATKRLENDDEATFGPGATRIDFEKAPDGTALTPGMDVGRTFVPKGFTISTSAAGAIVSVNNYDVQGRSRGNSCATHQPLWEGELTIRFCAPGRPDVPACVTRVGFWIAAVQPDGTALEAYDSKGKRIAEIKTTKNPNEFLGVRSRTPIAYIRVVPNVAIDPNYTIDDLVFDAPRPLEEYGHAELATLWLPGERILCKSARLKDGRWELEGLSCGIAKLARTAEPGSSLLTSLKSQKDPPADACCWARLPDGSVLRASGRAAADAPDREGLYSIRFATFKLEPAELVSICGSEKEYREPPPKALDTKPEGAKTPAWTPVEGEEKFNPWLDARFSAKGLDLDSGKEKTAFPYESAPPVFFRPLVKPKRLAGKIALTSGETLMLKGVNNPDATFELAALGPDGATVKQGANEVRIPVEDLMSVTAP